MMTAEPVEGAPGYERAVALLPDLEAAGLRGKIVDRLAGGYQEGAWLLRLDDGANAVLKFSNTRPTRARMAEAAGLVAHARERGWPTPAWLAWSIAGDGTPWHVQDYVDGAPMRRLTMARARQVVDVIERQTEMDPATAQNWSTYARAVVFADASDWRPALERFSDATRALVTDLRAWAAPTRDLPLPASDLVHGNLDIENVLMRGRRVVAFVDVGALGCGCRGYDIATLAITTRFWPAPAEVRALLVDALRRVAPDTMSLWIATNLMGLLEFGTRHWPAGVDPMARRAVRWVRDLQEGT